MIEHEFVKSSRRPALVTGEIYHIYNRGVDEREIFLADNDYYRFIHDMYEFNDDGPAPKVLSTRQDNIDNLMLLPEKKTRKLLVDIMVFCLMPNHFHMMVRQKIDSGISKFMQKIGTGYTNYFNYKLKRSGVLFQGKFKARHIENESHFMYLPHYLHLNPLDLFDPGWRGDGVRNLPAALKFLSSYRWSSYLDYTGCKNFPSVIDGEMIMRSFGGVRGYAKSIEKCIKVNGE